MRLDDIKHDLLLGRPVLIFDSWSREQEVDMVYYAGSINEKTIYKLRTEAGGLVCYATSLEVAINLQLPLLSELLSMYEDHRPLLEKGPAYGDKSAYSLWVNHIGVKTGISDIDRSLTIRMLHEVVSLTTMNRVDEARKRFKSEFYFPGHVLILISRGLKSRRGHTELAISLALMMGLEPSMVFAEMLDEGTSLNLSKARDYAKAFDLKLLEGEEILKLWVERYGP